MKKIKFITLSIIAIIGLNSCKNQAKEPSKNLETKKTEIKKETSHHENSLSLNEGKRWIANKETTEGVQNMIELMNKVVDKNTIEAYGKLTENLKLEFAAIFQKCTMKGEAHNQLHNFLIPIKRCF